MADELNYNQAIRAMAAKKMLENPEAFVETLTKMISDPSPEVASILMQQGLTPDLMTAPQITLTHEQFMKVCAGLVIVALTGALKTFFPDPD